MKTISAGSIVVVLLSHSGASAQEPLGHHAGESLLRASAGVFSPSGDSDYWDDKERDFTTSTDDFEDFTFSLDYVYFVSPRLGLMASVSGWEGKSTGSYRDFVDNLGGEISHVTALEAAWFEVGMLVHLLADRAPVMPYLGGGGSLISWELSEEGEFIDFGFEPPEVVRDRYLADGDGWGFFLLVGLEIPLGDRAAVFAEARWRDADVELGQDFAGFGTLDLSGRSITGGISFAF